MIRNISINNRSIFAGLTTSELLVQALARVRQLPIQETTEILAGSTFVAALLTSISQSEAVFGPLAQLFRLCLFVYAIYTVAPKLIPDQIGDWTHPEQRLIFAIGITGVAALISTETVEFTTTIISLLILLLTFVWIGILVPVWARESAPLDAPDGTVYRMVASIFNEPDRETGEIKGRIVRPAVAVLSPAPLVLAVSFVGFVVAGLWLLFPIPELLLLGWAAGSAMLERTQFQASPSLDLNWEDNVLKLVRLPLEDLHLGITTLGMVVLGVGAGIYPAGAALFIIPFLPQAISQLGWMRAFVTVTMPFAWLLLGTHSLWFWMRTSKRLSNFIRAEQGENVCASVARPAFWTIPGAVIAAAGSIQVIATGLYMHANPELTYPPAWLVFLVGMPLLIGGAMVGWSVRRTRRLDATDDFQPLNTDRAILPTALAVQLCSTSLFLGSSGSYEAIETEGLSGLQLFGLLGPRELLSILILIPGVFYTRLLFGSAAERTSREDNLHSIILIILILIAGALSSGHIY